MTPEEQVDLWVDGNPVHNDDVVLKVVDDYGNIVGAHKLARIDVLNCSCEFDIPEWVVGHLEVMRGTRPRRQGDVLPPTLSGEQTSSTIDPCTTIQIPRPCGR